MDYPEKLAAENNSHIVTDVDISNQQQQDEQDTEFSDEPLQDENNQNGDDPFAGVVQEETGNNEGGSVSEPAGLWQDGKLTKTITVEVSGSTAQLAIDCLVSAGLFDSYKEYETICKDLGYNPEQVYAGSFTFQTGSTKEIIVNKVNLGN